MATIYQVSELAGVSLATVSRVINNNDGVRKHTREKVLEAMQALDYQPNSFAQSLAANRSNCVGVLVSEVYGAIFGAMLSGIDAELRAAGKFTVFATGHNDGDKEREGIRFLTGRNCDALILHVEALPDEYLLENASSSTPFVLVNRLVPGLEQQCVCLDNEQGGYAATHALLQMGHRQIAYVSGPREWHDAKERLAGHKRALKEYGLRFDPDLMVEGDYQETGGERAAAQLLNSGKQFSALVCANDEMAAGAMGAVRAAGLGIPEDISIVGFDNAPLARYLYPKLSTVNYPFTEMGRMAARWVLKNVYDDDAQDIQNKFAARMIHRASASSLAQ